jgi:rod shape-determining protein MreC
MLDDYNSRIPVMGEASRVRAVLAGQASHPPELYTTPFEMQRPRLDFIVGAQSLREGERMITSGDGGLYPRGIPVGIARRDSDGQWHVALAASQSPVDFVRLLPYAGVEMPEATAPGNEAPPLNSASSVAAISHATMPPQTPASLQPASTPRPHRETTDVNAAPPPPAGSPQPRPVEAAAQTQPAPTHAVAPPTEAPPTGTPR